MSEENIGGEEGIIEERRKKLEALRSKKIAYVNDFYKEHYASDIHSENESFSKEQLEEKNIEGISVAGRIVLKRVMGNASFFTIRDSSGDIQIYVSKNTVDVDLYEDFKTWDLGDIAGVRGKLFRTRTEELTIEANDVVLITKSINLAPKTHLQAQGTKANPDSRLRLEKKKINHFSYPLLLTYPPHSPHLNTILLISSPLLSHPHVTSLHVRLYLSTS